MQSLQIVTQNSFTNTHTHTLRTITFTKIIHIQTHSVHSSHTHSNERTKHGHERETKKNTLHWDVKDVHNFPCGQFSRREERVWCCSCCCSVCDHTTVSAMDDRKTVGILECGLQRARRKTRMSTGNWDVGETKESIGSVKDWLLKIGKQRF